MFPFRAKVVQIAPENGHSLRVRNAEVGSSSLLPSTTFSQENRRSCPGATVTTRRETPPFASLRSRLLLFDGRNKFFPRGLWVSIDDRILSTGENVRRKESTRILIGTTRQQQARSEALAWRCYHERMRVGALANHAGATAVRQITDWMTQRLTAIADVPLPIVDPDALTERLTTDVLTDPALREIVRALVCAQVTALLAARQPWAGD